MGLFSGAPRTLDVPSVGYSEAGTGLLPIRGILRSSPRPTFQKYASGGCVPLSALPSLLYYGALIISRSRLGMRIAVIGAGGTGGYFGGLLAQAGEEVTFIARGAQLEALRRRGLTLESRLAGTFTIPVRATDDPSEMGPLDLVLFCVKTYDTDTAAQSIRLLIRPDTMLLSLQNGIDNEERIARVAGHTSGIGAVAYVTSVIKAPGVIAQTSGPGKIILGELSGGASARTERLHNVLQRAGITAEVHPDIRVVLWQKFLFICAFSGVTAVSRLPIGTILVDPETHALFQGMSEEVEAVARASGIDLPADCVEQALAIAAAAEPGAHGSLYHDLAVGRRLELESLNGEVVRRGANTASRRRLTSPSTPRCGRTSTALPYCRDLPATRRQRKRVRRRGVVRQLGRRRSRRGAGGPPAQPSRPPLRPGRVVVGIRAPARRRAGPTACQVARPAVAHAPWSRLVHRLPRDLQRKPSPDRGLARSLGFGHDTALERIAGSDSPERTFSASANRRCLPLFRGRGLGARRPRAGLAGWLRKSSWGWAYAHDRAVRCGIRGPGSAGARPLRRADRNDVRDGARHPTPFASRGGRGPGRGTPTARSADGGVACVLRSFRRSAWFLPVDVRPESANAYSGCRVHQPESARGDGASGGAPSRTPHDCLCCGLWRGAARGIVG